MTFSYKGEKCKPFPPQPGTTHTLAHNIRTQTHTYLHTQTERAWKSRDVMTPHFFTGEHVPNYTHTHSDFTDCRNTHTHTLLSKRRTSVAVKTAATASALILQI